MNTASRNHLSPRHRASAVAVLGAGLGIGLMAGCSSNGLRTTTGSEPSVHQPTPTGSPSPSTKRTGMTNQASRGTGAPTPTAGGASARPSGGGAATGSSSSSAQPDTTTLGRCSLDSLHVGVRVPDGAGTAGSEYVLLTFQNTSGTSCRLQGHPGVSFVGHGDGTQLGAPADRQPAPAPQVRLQAGETTTALLRITDAHNYNPKQCAPTTADGFRIYPPGSRSSAYVPFKTTACQRPMGSEHQLTVSPVGPISAHSAS